MTIPNRWPEHRTVSVGDPLDLITGLLSCCNRGNVCATGECVPLRVFLKPYALTPTYRATNKFSVKYFLNLVLVDEEDRRYAVRCCFLVDKAFSNQIASVSMIVFVEWTSRCQGLFVRGKLGFMACGTGGGNIDRSGFMRGIVCQFLF